VSEVDYDAATRVAYVATRDAGVLRIVRATAVANSGSSTQVASGDGGAVAIDVKSAANPTAFYSSQFLQGWTAERTVSVNAATATTTRAQNPNVLSQIDGEIGCK
jgi:hypothetical protein